MKYSEKLKLSRPFVNLGINVNRKNFTTQEKRLITTYFNKLTNLGYFDNITEGYQLVSIKSKRAPKIKGAPKIQKRLVEVGTVVVNGKLQTNPNRKVIIKNGKIMVTQNGAPRIWRFEYNIAKNWTQKEFIKHLKKSIGKNGLKKNQHFAIGAGIKYEVRNSVTDSLEHVAREIIKLGYRYTPNLKESYEHNGQVKKLSDWMQEIVVYEYIDDIKNRQVNRKFQKRKIKRGASRGKRNSNN